MPSHSSLSPCIRHPRHCRLPFILDLHQVARLGSECEGLTNRAWGTKATGGRIGAVTDPLIVNNQPSSNLRCPDFHRAEEPTVDLRLIEMYGRSTRSIRIHILAFSARVSGRHTNNPLSTTTMVHSQLVFFDRVPSMAYS